MPDLLRLGIAYRMQAAAHGELPAAALRQLRGGTSGSATPLLKPGTRLMRNWNGRSVSVTVSDDGFLFEDRCYKSLTAIAREVTGTSWSGPRFFGLKESSRG